MSTSAHAPTDGTVVPGGAQPLPAKYQAMNTPQNPDAGFLAYINDQYHAGAISGLPGFSVQNGNLVEDTPGFLMSNPWIIPLVGLVAGAGIGLATGAFAGTGAAADAGAGAVDGAGAGGATAAAGGAGAAGAGAAAAGGGSLLNKLVPALGAVAAGGLAGALTPTPYQPKQPFTGSADANTWLGQLHDDEGPLITDATANVAANPPVSAPARLPYELHTPATVLQSGPQRVAGSTQLPTSSAPGVPGAPSPTPMIGTPVAGADGLTPDQHAARLALLALTGGNGQPQQPQPGASA